MYTPISRSKPKGLSGFTLMELLVALVIIAILASLAYPSYISFIQKSRRSDAKAALMEISQQLERYYTQRNTYVSATLGNNGIYPDMSKNGYYKLSLPSAMLGATVYQIHATPVGKQTADDCGVFTLDNQGNQTVSQGKITDVAQCW